MKDFFNLQEVFGTDRVDLEFYSTAKRNVIVFQLDEERYIYWAVTGGEDHRIIVSAKGPFDNKLNEKDSGEAKQWKESEVDEEKFITNCKLKKFEIIGLFEKYILLWLDNLMIFSSKTLSEKPDYWQELKDNMPPKEAKLVSVYVNKDTLVKGDTYNATKRLVYELGKNKFVVVKTFSLEQQDEDFDNKYRSIKIWENADEKDVSSHWNTEKVTDIEKYLNLENLKQNILILKNLFYNIEVDVSITGLKL